MATGITWRKNCVWINVHTRNEHGDTIIREPDKALDIGLLAFGRGLAKQQDRERRKQATPAQNSDLMN